LQEQYPPGGLGPDENPCDVLADVPEDLDEGGQPRPLIDIEDVKPGDFGEVTFDFALCDNPGYLWMNGELLENAENGLTEPEADDPDEPDVMNAGLGGGLAGLVGSLALVVVLAGCGGPGATATETAAPSSTATATPADGTLEVHFINVGQSVSTLVVGPTGETMLIDAGHYNDDGAHVLTYLERHDVTRIDHLVVSPTRTTSAATRRSSTTTSARPRASAPSTIRASRRAPKPTSATSTPSRTASRPCSSSRTAN